MKDALILTTAGASIGLAIGLWLPVPGELGWLRCVGGGAAAFGAFGLGGDLLSRLHGRPIGWALGGPVGLTPGGAVWMALIAPVDHQGAAVIAGAIAGVSGGSICGSFLGAIALYRDIKAGRCTESAEVIGTSFVLLGTTIFCGAFGLLIILSMRAVS
jgi:hypothetical protein